MTTHILANITPKEQEAAIKASKVDFMELTEDEAIDADVAIAEMSTYWGKTENWVRRWLAATFLVLLSFVGGFDLGDHQNQDRVFRIVRVRGGRTGRREV